LIFEDVRKKYPHKEQRTTQEISLSPIASGSNKAAGQIKRSDLAVFYTEDGSRSSKSGQGFYQQAD